MNSARFVVVAVSGLLGLAGLGLLTGVGEPPASEPAAAPAVPAADTLFEVDPVHSNVLFKVQHAGLNHFYGRFNTFSGEFTLDPKAPANGHVNVSVDAQTIDTGNSQREDHLRNEEFFNTDKFPQITFKSTSITPGKDGGFVLKGDLTFLGVTKTISAPLTFVTPRELPHMGVRAAAETTFTIKRADFGFAKNFGGEWLGEEVTLIVSLQGGAK